MDARLFEALFAAWALRSAIDELARQKNAMILATYSNPNYDGKDGEKARADRIRSMEEHFAEAIEKLTDPTYEVSDDAMQSNEFLAPALRKTQQIRDQVDRVTRPGLAELDSLSELDLDQA